MLLLNSGCRTRGLRCLEWDLEKKSQNLYASRIMVEIIWQPQLSLSLIRGRSENACMRLGSYCLAFVPSTQFLLIRTKEVLKIYTMLTSTKLLTLKFTVLYSTPFLPFKGTYQGYHWVRILMDCQSLPTACFHESNCFSELGVKIVNLYATEGGLTSK